MMNKTVFPFLVHCFQEPGDWHRYTECFPIQLPLGTVPLTQLVAHSGGPFLTSAKRTQLRPHSGQPTRLPLQTRLAQNLDICPQTRLMRTLNRSPGLHYMEKAQRGKDSCWICLHALYPVGPRSSHSHSAPTSQKWAQTFMFPLILGSCQLQPKIFKDK